MAVAGLCYGVGNEGMWIMIVTGTFLVDTTKIENMCEVLSIRSNIHDTPLSLYIYFYLCGKCAKLKYSSSIIQSTDFEGTISQQNLCTNTYFNPLKEEERFAS